MKSTMTLITHYASRTLKALHRLGPATHDQIAAASRTDITVVRTYLTRYVARGHAVRVNPGINPAIHQISPAGAALVLAEREASRSSAPLGIVAQAIRTQPISIFHTKQVQPQYLRALSAMNIGASCA